MKFDDRPVFNFLILSSLSLFSFTYLLSYNGNLNIRRASPVYRHKDSHVGEAEVCWHDAAHYYQQELDLHSEVP